MDYQSTVYSGSISSLNAVILVNVITVGGLFREAPAGCPSLCALFFRFCMILGAWSGMMSSDCLSQWNRCSVTAKASPAFNRFRLVPYRRCKLLKELPEESWLGG